MRTLTERELDRAPLARQLLLAREQRPLPRVVEQIGGVQAQDAPSTYVGLWSRVADFEREHLDRALERRTVVQATLMRVTIHVVSSRDFWPLAEAIRESRRTWWLRATRHTGDAPTMSAAARRVRSLLADGPLPRNEIMARLGLDTTTWNGVSLWLHLVRVPASGTWDRRRADLFGLAEHWLRPSDASPDEGIDRLIRRYLGGFGPASRKDVTSFTGLPPAVLKPAFERMKLRRFHDEAGEELLDVPRAPLPDPETPAPVRFLPTWDATLLVHARRTHILPEQFRSSVFDTKTPHSVPTFTVDGQVAGTWRYERGAVRVQPFERLSGSDKRDVEEEAERLTAFHA